MTDSSLFFLGGLGVAAALVVGVRGLTGSMLPYQLFFISRFSPQKKNFKGNSHITHVMSLYLRPEGDSDMFDTESNSL